MNINIIAGVHLMAPTYAMAIEFKVLCLLSLSFTTPLAITVPETRAITIEKNVKRRYGNTINAIFGAAPISVKSDFFLISKKRKDILTEIFLLKSLDRTVFIQFLKSLVVIFDKLCFTFIEERPYSNAVSRNIN